MQESASDFDDGFWEVDYPALTGSAPAAPSYSGPIPEGYSKEDVEDFLRRNPGDEHRVMSALVKSPQGGGEASAPSSSGASYEGAPRAIQPYTPFSFDASSVGTSKPFTFRYDKAIEAVKRLGASRGTYFNPQTWKAVEAEASGLAADEVNNEYSRQADTYDRNFGTHAWNEEGRYNSERTNRVDDWGFMDGDRRFNRGVYEDDRNFNRGVLESDRGFGYQQGRDKVNDTWRFIDYGYGANR